MARFLYTEVPGGVWHVTSRGIARRRTFFEESDYRAFLVELSGTIRRYRMQCIAYCVMPNHFHVIVRTPEPTLADSMRDLKSDYARGLNARRGEDGSRFKRGFWRQLVQENEYLMTVAIYVALNPVRAGLVTDPANYPWSSFADTVSGRTTFVDASALLNLYGDDVVQARGAFDASVRAEGGLPFDPSLPILGDRAFVERHAPKERPGREVNKRAWEQARPSLDDLARGVEEEVFIQRARTQRYTIREIALRAGVSESTVARRLR